MARADRNWIPVSLVTLLLAGVVVYSGCTLPLARRTPSVPFSHRLHLEQDLECTDCHVHDPDTGNYRRTFPRICRLCHLGIDEDRPPERRFDRLYLDGAAAGPFFTTLDPEIIFDHRAHEGLECAECHDDLMQSERLVPDHGMTKPECMQCHRERGAPLSCDTCHTRTRETTVPLNHTHNWLQLHGPQSEERLDLCHLCHPAQVGPNSCLGCHLVTPPRNHNQSFRRRGHGVLAGLDRSSCRTCHESDFCIRCHENVRPTSHRGSFGSQRNTHCLGCHEPLASSPQCRICHLGTPSHAGPAQPADHVPGANCRLCHGFGAPLPHVDNGSECASCHP